MSQEEKKSNHGKVTETIVQYQEWYQEPRHIGCETLGVKSFTFVHDLDASLWQRLASGSRRDIHELEQRLVELEFAFPGIQLDLENQERTSMVSIDAIRLGRRNKLK